MVISGNCKIGEASFLGVNSTIADGINIEQKNLIGQVHLFKKIHLLRMFGCLQNPIYLLNQVHSFLNNMKNIIWKN